MCIRDRSTGESRCSMADKETVLVLEVVSKAHKGKAFEVGPKGATLGRKGLSLMYYKATGQIRFPEDEDRVSHKHATISKVGDGDEEYTIVDTGSLNGTWLDGERLAAERATSEPRPLKAGSVLNVGTYDFKVSYKQVDRKRKPPKKLAERRSAGVQKWRRWFSDTTAHLEKGGTAKDLPDRPGMIPTKQIKVSELREDQLDLPLAFRDRNSMAARAAEALGMSREDASVRPKSSIYDRLMPNTNVLTKVVASTVMHNKIREEEDWEKEVYGGAPQRAPQTSNAGEIGHHDLAMEAMVAETRKMVESELSEAHRREQKSWLDQDGVGSEHGEKRARADPSPAPGEKRTKAEPRPPPLSELPQWEQHQAPSGHFFWFNPSTGLSQWAPPPMQ
eukprot:TRINITY_DN5645_c0_g1_i2.p1 TRINITY_DN5645_c0_g1~~TRINITY_DN5645_c0_g1_i2.p1  ORF type:complete len:391 (+),score=96.17 TRINITY_DN5645_c0_g1_i2:187-1359(+)